MIHYSVGNEHSPMDFTGRFELTIEPGGAAHLEHHEQHQVRRFDGSVDTAALDAALARAGFPDQDREPIVPDTRMCSIRVGDQSVSAPHRDARYAEPIAILDSIVAELSA
jgi:hypothetical protein